MSRTLLLVLLLSPFLVFAQNKKVTGKVTDENGQPIADVTVSGKGSMVATISDENGNYSITVPATVRDLEFSSIGFASQTLRISGETLNVVMRVAAGELSQVVVTGYVQQNKRQSPGSVSVIKADEVANQPVASFDRAIQGKIPGVLSTSTSGQPGAPAQIIIRGQGSINGSNAPLFIMDGIEISSADFAALNTSDIETFTVLKDAASTAIYGSRGANGVVVITTKKGRAGATRVNYDFQVGWSELPPDKLPLMTSAEKINYEVNYDRPDGLNPFGWTPSEQDSLSRIDNRIRDELFRKGKMQMHQLNLSGGSDKTVFYASLSVFDQEGIVRNTDFKRYTGRLNVEHRFSQFKLGINTTVGYSKRNSTLEESAYVGAPLNAVRWFNPYITLRDADGNYQIDFLQDQPNPLQEIEGVRRSTNQFKAVANAYLEYKAPFLPGLSARTNWGIDYSQIDSTSSADPATNLGGQQTGSTGMYGRYNGYFSRYTGTTSVTYENEVGDHNFRISLFNEILKYKFNSNYFRGFGWMGPFKNEAGITPGTYDNGFIPEVAGNASQSALLSYFADGSYGYKDRYFLSAGVRRDGSSRFGADNKWATFGQVGFSWIMSDEAFLENTDFLDELKFKISYGSVGNQIGIGNFASRELYSATSYNGMPGVFLTNLANPSLRWEKKVILNTGFEFSLFNRLLVGSVEYYNSVTKDLFLNQNLSRTSGFGSIQANLGELRNSGIEVGLTANLVRGVNWQWTLGANYTYNKNKIISQPGQPKNFSGVVINEEGYPANSLYLVKVAGVDPETGEELYYDLNGNITNVYSANNRQNVGTVIAPHFGGLTNTLTYRGITLDVVFSYAFGNVLYNNDRTNVENPDYWFSSLSSAMLREWRKPGDITDIPSSEYVFRSTTTRFMEKGDFLRLRNIQLSYSLPKVWLDRIGVRNASIYLSGQNVHVWHNFKGYDPEFSNPVVTGSVYPQLRSYSLGLNIGL